MHFPPLPDEETAMPPPPPDPEGSFYYGYKIFDGNFDETIPDHDARLGRAMCAASRLGPYTEIFCELPTVVVYLALYNPKLGIVTHPAGRSRVPGPQHLNALEKEMGVDGGPVWLKDENFISWKNYTREGKQLHYLKAHFFMRMDFRI
ncbi:hypothetical protein C8R43DRAFT_1103421 [Mycena crocata]|nr:hypothetical protein C8R43DRAFT_1103421 [Mycena crocata]